MLFPILNHTIPVGKLFVAPSGCTQTHGHAHCCVMSNGEKTPTHISVPAKPFIQSPPTALQILIDDLHARGIGKYQLPCFMGRSTVA